MKVRIYAVEYLNIINFVTIDISVPASLASVVMEECVMVRNMCGLVSGRLTEICIGIPVIVIP